jgi:hypothetical protein
LGIAIEAEAQSNEWISGGIGIWNTEFGFEDELLKYVKEVNWASLGERCAQLQSIVEVEIFIRSGVNASARSETVDEIRNKMSMLEKRGQ